MSGPKYVALGSSFAAGIGLGKRAPGSPVLCMRSVNGYPQQLAKMAGFTLVDRTCSGAKTRHVLRGGQYFQDAQLNAVDADTHLVTLTIGGNDVGYVRDLMLLARRRKGGVLGAVLRLLWKGPPALGQRSFDKLRMAFDATFAEIRRRAPKAIIVAVTYPAILPATGTHAEIGISEGEAGLMREVAASLAGSTSAAAHQAGALVVDMAALSAEHHAGSGEPWVHGASPMDGTAFHPTLAGAQATAREIYKVVESSLLPAIK